MRSKTWLLLIVGVALAFSVPSCLIALEDSTQYAAGFRESKFRTIRLGMSEADVIRTLGQPLETKPATQYIEWIYGPPGLRIADDGGLDDQFSRRVSVYHRHRG